MGVSLDKGSVSLPNQVPLFIHTQNLVSLVTRYHSFIVLMPGTQQIAQRLDWGETRPRLNEEWHSTISHDHQGRPFQSIWKGDDSAKPPRFSWQVYTTTSTNLNDDSIGIAALLGGIEFAEYEAAFAIYAPLPSTYACIAHQKLERQYAKNRSLLVDQSPHNAIKPECYGREPHLGGFIIIIDTAEWKTEGGGPLFASFDIRPAKLAIVEPCLNAEDAGIFEQIEMKITRQRQSNNLGLDLKTVWMDSGGYDWELCDAEVLEKLSASQEEKSLHYPLGNMLSLGDDFHVQSSDHNSELRQVQIASEAATETAANMTYSIYATIPDAQTSEFNLEDTARFFTAAIVSHLPTPAPTIFFQFFGSLPDIDSCISHHYSHTRRSPGYQLSGSKKRRYPLHGIDAAGAEYVEEPDYRTFLVVLDKMIGPLVEEGVLFVWDDLKPQPEDLLLQSNTEALAGRLPDMKTVAKRLAGLL